MTRWGGSVIYCVLKAERIVVFFVADFFFSFFVVWREFNFTSLFSSVFLMQ